MKNVIESIWSGLDAVIQTELGVEVGKGRVCYYSEGGGGGTRVEDCKVGQLVYQPNIIVLLFLGEENNCSCVYSFLELLVLLLSTALLSYSGFCGLLNFLNVSLATSH